MMFKHIRVNKLKSSSIFDLLLRPLVIQSNDKLKDLFIQYEFKQKPMYTLILLITTWLLYSTFLTKAFNAVLRNSYFNTKSYPVFSNLDDIINNDQSLIDGYGQYIENLDTYFYYDQDKSKKLVKKLKTYRELNNLEIRESYLTMKVLKDLKNGLIALLLPTSIKNDFLDIYSFDQDDISVSDDKYFSTFFSFYVSKFHFLFNEITFL